MTEDPRVTGRLPQYEAEAVEEKTTGNQFGTFGGVFTPSILTILGVIMFMRAGFVVGEAGVLGAILILVIAKGITLMTAFSVSAISTNMQVRGGGAYFMISRVLGGEFGGAIGLALFFAQALSVPFYILGFTEALVNTFEPLQDYFLLITLSSGAFLYIVAYVGADWAIRTQYFIMAVLILAIIVTMGGLMVEFSPERFQENWTAGYSPVNPAQPLGERYNFWMIFAIYFPAVTGILAGVNMSGDLKDPSHSIPLGTFLAIGVSFVVYFILALLLGGAVDRVDMIEESYKSLKAKALFKLEILVALGVFAASLSSALGSYLGAPRILQAVARDDILGVLKPFAKGSEVGDEPRRALVLTGFMTLVVLLWAGNDSKGGPLNAVAAIITMFFLYTYGMTNLAAFYEAFGGNPSFRPRFKYFHWSTAMLGAIGCVAMAFLIDWQAAIAAALILIGLLWYLKTRELETSFGDARRGFAYSALRKNLLKLSDLEEDSKNWRPTILVFSGNPSSRETLVSYAVWLESGRGIVLLANVLDGQIKNHVERRKIAEKQLREFCDFKRIQAFPVIAIEKDLGASVSLLLQTTSIGPVRPNLTMFGWTNSADRFSKLAGSLRIAEILSMSLVLCRDRGVPTARQCTHIDIWWRGRKNGELMVILAHLLRRNWEWLGCPIRVLRVVDDIQGQEPAQRALQKLINQARVDAQAIAVVSEGRAFTQILYEESQDASCVFLGFETPDLKNESRWFASYEKLLKGLPTTLLVNSVGIEDMFA